MLQHIVLHVGLCAPMASRPPEASLPIRVQVTDRVGESHLDKVFAVERGYDDQKQVAFDMDRGVYRLKVSSGARNAPCSSDTFVQVLGDVDRSVSVTLQPGPQGIAQPLLFAGTAPQSFLYAQPTYVVLRSTVTCNTPVGTPLPSNVSVLDDQTAYYATVESDLPLTTHGVLALRLKTPTSQYHYVRVPFPFPTPWGGWPSSVHFDVNEDIIDEVSGKPIDTLLCLKLFKTSSG